jgi:hypothetical protein
MGDIVSEEMIETPRLRCGLVLGRNGQLGQGPEGGIAPPHAQPDHVSFIAPIYEILLNGNSWHFGVQGSCNRFADTLAGPGYQGGSTRKLRVHWTS